LHFGHGSISGLHQNFRAGINNRLVFVMDNQCVFCKVLSEFLSIIQSKARPFRYQELEIKAANCRNKGRKGRPINDK
jgi:hypothetical protein